MKKYGKWCNVVIAYHKAHRTAKKKVKKFEDFIDRILSNSDESECSSDENESTRDNATSNPLYQVMPYKKIHFSEPEPLPMVKCAGDNSNVKQLEEITDT